MTYKDIPTGAFLTRFVPTHWVRTDHRRIPVRWTAAGGHTLTDDLWGHNPTWEQRGDTLYEHGVPVLSAVRSEITPETALQGFGVEHVLQDVLRQCLLLTSFEPSAEDPTQPRAMALETQARVQSTLHLLLTALGAYETKLLLVANAEDAPDLSRVVVRSGGEAHTIYVWGQGLLAETYALVYARQKGLRPTEVESIEHVRPGPEYLRVLFGRSL